MPYPLKAIQIDGGSEFIAEFETTGTERNPRLYILPPRSPKLNGDVERYNQTWRYEFHGCVELPNDIEKIAKMSTSSSKNTTKSGPAEPLNT